ncbi:MAG: HlyC/CorC family transporter [Crenarchaeota archaeon]|nr:MAG: HlyC/CorC family transporter [Thermoproteota archaeon]RDJ34137.1 MAG: HlyC/CorC family transporter [Thermoproteota archaeon]RDJ36747.1 MAG: HlyC/CorC family transporter [Thermoproteota archaeon]RDJ37719.1 MAG: HlyC/CorC family transporter [Thermoproteota archaeon]
MVDVWAEIAALAALIGLSGFFSGLEVALVGTSQATVERLVKEHKRGSKALQKLKSNPGWMMSAVNLGNNLVNVGSSALATVVAIEIFGDEGLGIAVGIMTFLIIIFGEVTPKTYCNANASKVALRASPILIAFSYVTYPVVWILERITRIMIKITGSDYHPPALTEAEIMGIIDQGHRDKALEGEESRMVRSALEFDDTALRSVMTPRTKMMMLPADMLLFEALPKINQSPHSRFPIYGESVDDIVGFVHVRDILKEFEHDNKMIKLKEISRDPVFASQEKMVSALLKEMKGRKTHMAIVIDEHGGVEGLVTLEDLIEEIVGDIEDETDHLPGKDFHMEGEDTLIITSNLEIDKINEVFKIKIPKGEDYGTINGLLHEKLHDIPKEGDKVEIAGVKIVVEKVDKNVPERIRMEKIHKKNTTEDESKN